MHSINRLNFKVGIFLLFLTLGMYSVHALVAYDDLLVSKYFVEYKGTIINRWVKSEDGRIDKLEEWDEEQMPDGVYNFSKETVDSLFSKPIEDDGDEW